MHSLTHTLFKSEYPIRKSLFLDNFFVIGIFFGILLMGSKFTHIGFERLYIVEYAIILLNISLAMKIFQHSSVRLHIYQLLKGDLIYLAGLLALGLTTLLICLDNGFLSMRQSLITLYASLVFIYIYSFNSEKSLINSLYLLLIFFSFFNCIKIFTYLYLGLTHEDEPYRVKHEETDAIFSAIALLGLLAYRKSLFTSQKLLFIVLILLNLVVLFLTIKRTAFIGLFLGSAFIFYQEKIFQAISKRHLLITTVVFLAVSIATAILFREQIHNVTQILLKKINVLSENNTVWRIQAWKIALDDISNSPIWGNGYGHRILKESLKGVDTMDPHNSYLAITAYNGLLGLALLVASLVISFKKYCSLLISTNRPEERNAVLFFSAGFIFMVTYAFFNVTLEVQRLAIFYWFFVAGSFLLGRLRTASSDLKTVSTTPTNIRAAILVAGIAIYAGSLGLSENYIKRIDIYLPANQGQFPDIKSPVKDIAVIRKESDQFTLALSAQEGRPYTELQWIIPNDIYAIKGREKNYYAIFELEGNTEGIGFQFRTFDGAPIDAENLFPHSNKIVVSLASLANKDLKKIYGIALIIPHDKKDKELIFHRVAIETMELHEEYALFSDSGANQVPTLLADGSLPPLDMSNHHITVRLPGSENISYASLNWQLPLLLNEEYLGKEKFLQVQFNSVAEAQDNFIQISNDKSYITLENITPGSKAITLDLLQIDKNFITDITKPNTLSLHLKHEQEKRRIEIKSIKLFNQKDFFNKITIFSGADHEDLFPHFYTENNGVELSREFTGNSLLIKSKKSLPGWSSIYWPFPKVNIPALDIGNYSLVIDLGETPELSSLHFGFTINGEYVAIQDHTVIAKNTLQIPTTKIAEALMQSSLAGNDIGFNISTPAEPHDIYFYIKEISLVKKD